MDEIFNTWTLVFGVVSLVFAANAAIAKSLKGAFEPVKDELKQLSLNVGSLTEEVIESRTKGERAESDIRELATKVGTHGEDLASIKPRLRRIERRLEPTDAGVAARLPAE